MIKRFKDILNSHKLLLPAVLTTMLFIVSCVPGGTTVPRGWSGATVVDGVIYIGSMDGKVVAVNATDGRRVWDAQMEVTVPPSGGFACAASPPPVAIYGSPAVSGNLVYVGGYNGKFYAFAPGEPEPRWVYPREGTADAQIVGGALVVGDNVYFGTAGGKVYALNAATGSTAAGWIFPAGDRKEGKIWSTPAFLDGTLFVGSLDNKLYAVDAATGKEKWEFETGGAIVAAPVADDGTVYVGSFDRNLYAVDAATGREKWRFQGAENWFWAKTLISESRIYAANLDGRVYILDTLNGNKLDEFVLDSPISSSPIITGDYVIVATEGKAKNGGVVYALETSGAKRTILDLRNSQEKVQAPLAADGSAVYLRTSTDNLYAVDVRSGAELWNMSLETPVQQAPATTAPQSGGMSWGLLITVAIISFVVLMGLRWLMSKAGARSR